MQRLPDSELDIMMCLWEAKGAVPRFYFSRMNLYPECLKRSQRPLRALFADVQVLPCCIAAHGAKAKAYRRAFAEEGQSEL